MVQSAATGPETLPGRVAPEAGSVPEPFSDHSPPHVPPTLDDFLQEWPAPVVDCKEPADQSSKWQQHDDFTMSTMSTGHGRALSSNWATTRTSVESGLSQFGKPFRGNRSIPGLDLPSVDEKCEDVSSPSEGLPRGTSVDLEDEEDTMHVSTDESDPSDTSLVEWHIRDVARRLKFSCGQPIISAPVKLAGLSFRLLFVPGRGWAPTRSLSSQKRGGRVSASSAQDPTVGPLHGSINLKVDECVPNRLLQCFVKIGSGSRQGPFDCDFSERNVQECVLSEAWLDRVEGSNLKVCVELV